MTSLLNPFSTRIPFSSSKREVSGSHNIFTADGTEKEFNANSSRLIPAGFRCTLKTLSSEPGFLYADRCFYRPAQFWSWQKIITQAEAARVEQAQWIKPRILNETWALLSTSTGTTALFPGDSSVCVSCPSSPWQERESCFQISPTSAPVRSNTTKTALVPVYIKTTEVETLEISIFQSVKWRQQVILAYLTRDLGWHINVCSAFKKLPAQIIHIF